MKSTIHLSLIWSMFPMLCIETFTITTPSSSNDYQQLASLLVETFDQPSPSAKNETRASPLSRKWEQLSWEMYDKFLTEQQIRQQYMQNARKMKGKKYALFLANEYNPGILSNDRNDEVVRPFYEVAGMIELGMVLEPPIWINNEHLNDEYDDEFKDRAQKRKQQQLQLQTLLQPRAKVGVLCVKQEHMKKGIGKALIQKCEHVVRNLWNRTQLFVEVEPDNVNAMKFFHSCGYEVCIDENNNEIIRYAKVSRRRKVEERPHCVLVKSLNSVSEEVESISSPFNV